MLFRSTFCCLPAGIIRFNAIVEAQLRQRFDSKTFESSSVKYKISQNVRCKTAAKSLS